MILELNGLKHENINLIDIMKKIKNLNYKDEFDLIINIDKNNWVQIFKENDYISLAKSEEGNIHYLYRLPDEIDIEELVNMYCSNPNSCSFTWDDDGKKKIKKEVKLTKRNRSKNLNQSYEISKFMFLCYSFILVFQISLILINSRYHGNLIYKIYQYYTDKNVYIKSRGVILLWIMSLIAYIYNVIKMTNKKRCR